VNKKKKKVEINGAALSGDEGKYMKYVSFPWSLLAAALPMLNISLCC
jgi:hypothetical protein